MITEKAIENLNTLLCINNDRVEGYKSAIYEAKEVDIKIMFSTLAQTSLDCRKELIQELKKIGGKRNNGFRETGKFFNVWREMKKAIKKDDRQTILYSCKHGENVVLREYLKIINGSVSEQNLECESVLYRQYKLLKADYERINQLHNYFQEEREEEV
ncbi:MAG TPA: PA2169 family four-helix-bundle protein [Flavobacterium sp.]|uniref:PA2169 family four-helix-bundle protein n=1 Tax=unclassified Flavobacterium TaxID=196869 RepID=UPI0025C4097E|nr:MULTISPECIES: PA2169 family four-helix-bundle protein [unclassified Flavobacterium]HRE78836.1 PA2169 family four-helix-bundle protein [Flavobacterium sp.]